MRAKLVRGRFFDDRDGPTSPLVIIVDEKLAHRFWPNQDPVGRRMYRPTDLNNLIAVNERTRFLTVVGVVHDIKLADLVEGNGAVGSYFYPLSQDTSRGLTFAVRTATDPAALATPVREAIRSLDRELPVFDSQTMEERTDKSLISRRSPVMLSVSFGSSPAASCSAPPVRSRCARACRVSCSPSARPIRPCWSPSPPCSPSSRSRRARCRPGARHASTQSWRSPNEADARLKVSRYITQST